MATNAEIAALSRELDALALDDAAKIVRRRMKKPAGVSTALFCRTLTMEAVCAPCRGTRDRSGCCQTWADESRGWSVMGRGDYLADALKATVVGRQRDDGTWICDCGQIVPTDLALYAHRQREHDDRPGLTSPSP